MCVFTRITSPQDYEAAIEARRDVTKALLGGVKVNLALLLDTWYRHKIFDFF